MPNPFCLSHTQSVLFISHHNGNARYFVRRFAFAARAFRAFFVPYRAR
jgi:hypothetical protein